MKERIEERNLERKRIEREVKEAPKKELQIRLQEEQEEEKKEEARMAKLCSTPQLWRQKPCRHGYGCKLYWVSWQHCSMFHHPSNMGVWENDDEEK